MERNRERRRATPPRSSVSPLRDPAIHRDHPNGTIGFHVDLFDKSMKRISQIGCVDQAAAAYHQSVYASTDVIFRHRVCVLPRLLELLAEELRPDIAFCADLGNHAKFLGAARILVIRFHIRISNF